MDNNNPHHRHTTNYNDVSMKKQEIKERKDENGNVLRYKLDENGRVIFRERLVNNKKGKTTPKIITNVVYDEKGRVINRHNERYNASGELIKCNERINTYSGSFSETQRIDYQCRDGIIISKNRTVTIKDPLKNIVSTVKQHLNSDGNVTSSTECKYNKSNEVIELVKVTNSFASNGVMVRSNKEVYDKNNNLLLTSKRKIIYLNDGLNIIEVKVNCHGDGKFIERIITEKQKTSDGKVVCLIESEYDKSRFLTRKVVTKFDDFGNKVSDVKYNSHIDDAGGKNENIICDYFDISGKLKERVKECIITTADERSLTSVKSIYNSMLELIYEVDVSKKINDHGDLIVKTVNSRDLVNFEKVSVKENYGRHSIITTRTTSTEVNMSPDESSSDIKPTKVLLTESFDSRGNMVASEKAKVNADGSIVGNVIVSQRFDDNNNLVVRKEEWYNEKGKRTDEVITKYVLNSDGQLIEKFITEEILNISGFGTTKIRKAYDANEKLNYSITETEHFNSDNIRYALDKKYEYFDSSGKIISRHIDNYEIDADGKTVSQIQISQKFDLDGNLQSCSGAEYNNGVKVKDFVDIYRDGHNRRHGSSYLAQGTRGDDDDHYCHEHVEHQYVQSDQLTHAINSFDTIEGVATPIDKPFMPKMNSNTLVAPL
ncbi:hypothetical protein [Yersinia sp. Marseille-Q3913]|uniref:hypothetical protein n=1 Tax=Yersinia sp. Marseille-Q3913 TaxID=2830769 RepID=UPI001BAF43C4|nr:hypothetical protein [Yersinia sp. Marseille-Q3913]MBS0057259.1 hypothetical protein [Yersinia sp. Marseille-Q3913]